MKILIIGGSRFVGLRLMNLLSGRGHEVTVYNRGTNKYVYPPGVKFIKGDRKTGFKIKEHFNTVVDMCAYKKVDTAKALKDLHFDFFVHMSTAAVYKKNGLFPLREDSQIGKWPLWGDYNIGKVQCEKVLQKSKIKYAIIRPVYILGVNNPVKRESFIYSKIMEKNSITLPGNGEAVVQFVFADDVAKTLLLIIENKKVGIYNCSNDESVTLRALVNMMAKIVKKDPIIRFNPKADGEAFKEKEFPFANENFFCANENIKSLGLKFRPLFEGLKKDYELYYRRHSR
ncbi:MAG: NAD-dependent epimerase/dehydratase family protein [Candidatus Paceibacterota bacterium]|jgi:nucleoside-diphosphate-sugar epimerase